MKKQLLILLFCFSTTHLLSQPKTAKPTADTTIYTAVEVSPQFPGGDEALGNYLIKNLHLPKTYIESGDVSRPKRIQFIVEKDGRISNISFLKEISIDLKLSFIKLIKAMPKWISAKTNGKPVRCKFIIPINCILFGDM